MIKKREIICFILSILMANVIINFNGNFISSVIGQSSEEKTEGSIVLKDPKLKAELVVSGLELPTSIVFIDKNDFLIIEKETGLVKRVMDGKILEPLLQLNVSGKDERGLLGIDIDKKQYSAGLNVIYVYLSYVECESKEACENKIVRYELDGKNKKLIYPKEIFSIKSFPDDSYVGGVIKVGPDHNVYVTVGDFHGINFTPVYETQAQNFENGVSPDGRAGILRISPDGDPIDNGILGQKYPLNLYFAYGIKNSFGIDFDPLTGYLWDTENGPDYGDEINLVEPGFNSGALKIFGKSESGSNSDYKFDNVVQSSTEEPNGLVTFNGSGRYSDPELTWQETVAPTSVTFLDSNALGNNYRYDMFVSTAGGGKIYNFDLSQDRKQLVLKDVLADKSVDSDSEEDSITFAEGFTTITDLEMNPYDGSLYVVSPVDGDSRAGSVYKIVSNSAPEPIQDPPLPNIIQDPASPENPIKFPLGSESRQGDPLKNIQDQNTTINNNNNNNDLTICDKLKSFDNVLSDTWIDRKITDEQVMYLSQQVKELMVEAGCIN
jgi:aldose sugar dehydrogenase